MTQSRKAAGGRRLWRRLGCLLAVLVVVGGLAALGIYRARLVTTQPDVAELLVLTAPVERGDLIDAVQVNGALEPVDRARLSFPANAQVAEVLVSEGQQVAAGAILARLEDRDLTLKVASAQARVDEAQQALDKLLAGPTPADTAQAAARVARARADLAAADSEVRQIDIDLARTRLEQAQADLEELRSGQPTEEARTAERQLLAAQEGLLDSQQALEQTRDSASRAKTQAEQALTQGADAVAKAQRAYSDAYWDWDFVQRTSRHPRDEVTNADGSTERRRLEPHEIEQFRRTLEDAELALRDAETALKNLQDAYDQAREDEVRQVDDAGRSVDTARRALTDAQRDYERALGEKTADALLEARKNVADAQKAYTELVDNPTRPARRVELEATLLEALAAQEKLAAGSDPIELAKARTALEEARSDLAQAEADLAEAILRAPIAGTVVDITLKPGTRATTSDAITIVDLSSFLLRGQVTEQNVARVAVGQAVEVRVDSLPELAFRGELTRVSELPSESDQSQSQGSSFGPGGFAPTGALGGLYPVEMTIEATDDRLRVGMAATANIEILALRDTLIIPLQAVSQGPDGPTVQRTIGPPGPDGQPPAEEVAITLGETSGDRVQVLSGLAEGDTLILSQLPPPEFGPPGGMP